MSLRGPSGKFSLAHFGRKASGAHNDGTSNGNGYGNDYPDSPTREGGSGFMSGGGGGGSGGNGSNPLDGIGKKLGKSLAHQSLVPGLGNKEQRTLQDLINAEKGVMQSVERFSQESQKAGSALQAYGAQEGADLADILTHSSTLLDQLGTALAVFVDHSANLRGCYKRIREREEELDELRRRRRATGAKSESAEKKLAKMGPENKQLPSQTELLERLRGEMRQMDTDIINEESRLGDFKRQQIKEALSSKFGGLEELGEKMCIIGELGKLLLEEVPLEETPPGYGRAPYQGYVKTESAVNEATKCLATVRFSAGSASPYPPGMSTHSAPQNPNPQRVAAAEEFGNLPIGENGVTPKGKEREYSLDTADPYGGLSNPYDQHRQYDEYGGTRGDVNDRHVMFQGPNDDVAQSSHQNYEYEQQQQLDAEEKAWREGQPTSSALSGLGAPVVAPAHHGENAMLNSEQVDEGGLGVPWQPLNVKRERPTTPSVALQDGGAPQLDQPDLGDDIHATSHPAQSLQQGYSEEHVNGAYGQSNDFTNEPTTMDLPPPPPIGSMSYGGAPTPSEREGFYTPLQGPTPEPHYPTTMPTPPSPPAPPPAPAAPAPPPPPPAPIPVPSPAIASVSQTYNSAPGSGKISAAAFRRGVKNRGSADPEDMANYGSTPGSGQNQSPESTNRPSRKLPLPPPGMPDGFGGGRSETPIEAGYELPSSPGYEGRKRLGDDAYDEARPEEHPPPSYGHGESLR